MDAERGNAWGAAALAVLVALYLVLFRPGYSVMGGGDFALYLAHAKAIATLQPYGATGFVFNPANAITTTPRDLTVDDAAALRRASAVSRLAPLTVGTSEISFGGRLREIIVAGSTSDFIPIRNFELAQGRGLPEEDWNRGSSVAVIGSKIREELFGKGTTSSGTCCRSSFAGAIRPHAGRRADFVASQFAIAVFIEFGESLRCIGDFAG